MTKLESFLLHSEHLVFEEQERETDCFTLGDPWLTYFENHYLGQYTAITNNLRIFQRHFSYKTKKGRRIRVKLKKPKPIAIYVNPSTGKAEKAPYRKFLKDLDSKVNEAFHVDVPERTHLLKHLQVRVVQKHREEIRRKLEE